ncbi:hypothetical protein [Synechococcus sp. LA31]|uniref:hypothetical protein n=1 Tax=Synechococcus sp. LA31 TaxID=2741953 RepID=UPI001BDC9D1E|nr:hypothetical protein [Synechococcus sp. LA31]QVV68731.1 hypothetical protein KJJ24_06345 [Synechococcus sp. LA31]
MYDSSVIGIFSLSLASANLLSVFTYTNLRRAFIPLCSSAPKYLRLVSSLSFLFTISISVGFSVAFSFHFYYAACIGFLVVSLGLSDLGLELALFKGQSLLYSLNYSLRAILLFPLSLAYAHFLDPVTTCVFAYSTSCLVTACYLFFAHFPREYTSLYPNARDLSTFISFSTPLSLSSLCTWALDNLDKYYVSYSYGNEVFGLYLLVYSTIERGMGGSLATLGTIKLPQYRDAVHSNSIQALKLFLSRQVAILSSFALSVLIAISFFLLLFVFSRTDAAGLGLDVASVIFLMLSIYLFSLKSILPDMYNTLILHSRLVLVSTLVGVLLYFILLPCLSFFFGMVGVCLARFLVALAALSLSSFFAYSNFRSSMIGPL